MKKRTKKDYTTEFRNRAVSMVLKSDKSVAQIARDLGITGTTLYSWVNSKKWLVLVTMLLRMSNYSMN